MRVRAVCVAFLLAGQAAADDSVLVAVASNFANTAAEVAARFEDEHGTAVRLSAGSTGKLYAQIVNGAPFDVFLAADAERPGLLEQRGHAVSGSRRTYAIGRLVVYSVKADDCLGVLRDTSAGHVAMANPKTAPYGAAAQQFLDSEGLRESVPARIVYGESVAQALHFAATGNASVAFVASAQLQSAPTPSCTYTVPAAAHDALVQQAVLLDDGNAGARAFLEYLGSAAARRIIEDAGYEVPP